MNTLSVEAGESIAPGVQEMNEPRDLGCYDWARQLRLIACKEFADRFRSGWVIACVVVWLGAIALTSLFGLLQIGQIGWQGYERTVISLLNLVQYLVPLLGLLLGHDLVVSEREERTLNLLLAAGISRTRLLLGKFLGGCMTLAVPLLLGFTISGIAVGIGARDRAVQPLLTLAVSGLVLGIVFVAIGLLASTLSKTRVQALVIALLAWCAAVFVFDLVALGTLISTKVPTAAQEIDVACDTMHINSSTDIHSAFDAPASSSATTQRSASSFHWLLINPVDLFRAVNLSKQMNLDVPVVAGIGTVLFWLAGCLTLSAWRFRHLDL